MIPPHSEEAEQSCLAVMMLGTEDSRAATAKVIGTIRPEDMYSPRHHEIYKAILSLYNKGAPIDVVTTTEELKSSGQIGRIGGESVVAKLVDVPGLISHVEEYIKILKDYSLRREILMRSQRVYEGALTHGISTDDLVHQFSQAGLEISRGAFTQSGVEASNGATREAEQLFNQSLAQERGEYFDYRIRTGFPSLDRILIGLDAGNIYLIAARPGIGKTSLAIDLAMHASGEQDVAVAFFSLEMSSSEIFRKMLSSVASIDSHLIRSNHIFEDERTRLSEAAVKMSSYHIMVDDTSRLSPIEVRARSRAYFLQNPKRRGLIVVDYVQLMDASLERMGHARHEEVAMISRSLKSVAREMDCPLIMLSQLNRMVEARDEPEPRLSDLRESGALEQDASAVIFLYGERNEVSAPEQVRYISVAKNRFGATGTAQLRFNKPYTKFEEIT